MRQSTTKRNFGVAALLIALVFALAQALFVAATVASGPVEAQRAGSSAKLKDLRLRADTSIVKSHK